MILTLEEYMRDIDTLGANDGKGKCKVYNIYVCDWRSRLDYLVDCVSSIFPYCSYPGFYCHGC